MRRPPAITARPSLPLVERARRGETITLIDKIEDEQDLDALSLMQEGAAFAGLDLSIDELQAFSRRRAVLQKQLARRREGARLVAEQRKRSRRS